MKVGATELPCSALASEPFDPRSKARQARNGTPVSRRQSSYVGWTGPRRQRLRKARLTHRRRRLRLHSGTMDALFRGMRRNVGIGTIDLRLRTGSTDPRRLATFASTCDSAASVRILANRTSEPFSSHVFAIRDLHGVCASTRANSSVTSGGAGPGRKRVGGRSRRMGATVCACACDRDQVSINVWGVRLGIWHFGLASQPRGFARRRVRFG